MQALGHGTVDFSEVRGPIDQVLRSFGFSSRSKRMWHRHVGRVIQMVHLDKSSYGPQNRLHIYFSFDNLVNLERYKIGDFDIRLIFDNLPKCSADFRSALDQETTGMARDVRESVIYQSLSEYLNPILKLAVDEKGFRELRKAFPSKNDLFISPRLAAIIFSDIAILPRGVP